LKKRWTADKLLRLLARWFQHPPDRQSKGEMILPQHQRSKKENKFLFYLVFDFLGSFILKVIINKKGLWSRKVSASVAGSQILVKTKNKGNMYKKNQTLAVLQTVK
jgi:hypothetical protein